MKPTHEELEHIACEMSQQDWNDLRFADVYYKAFVEGGKWFMRSYEQLEQERNELAAKAERFRGDCGTNPIGYLYKVPNQIPTFFESKEEAAILGCDVFPVYATTSALKAHWEADILLSTSIQIAAGKQNATPIQIATALLEESNRIRQCK